MPQLSRPFETGDAQMPQENYALLHNEIDKPNDIIDWVRVDSLCLNLFYHGVANIQVAAWYTLSRTHLKGLSGLCEGLILLKVLLGCQWENSNLEPVQVSIDILESMVISIQNHLNILKFTKLDLMFLHRAKQHTVVLQEIMYQHAPQKCNPFLSLLHTLSFILKSISAQNCAHSPNHSLDSGLDKFHIPLVLIMLMIVFVSLFYWVKDIEPRQPFVWPNLTEQIKTAPGWLAGEDSWMELLSPSAESSPYAYSIELLKPGVSDSETLHTKIPPDLQNEPVVLKKTVPDKQQSTCNYPRFSSMHFLRSRADYVAVGIPPVSDCSGIHAGVRSYIQTAIFP